LAVLVAAAVCGAVLAAIISGLLGGDDKMTISGSPKQAVAVVESYSAALARHDWPTICVHLYGPAARAAAGGAECPLRLEQAAGRVTEPRLRILSVDVHGSRATVQVQAAVNGGPALESTIELEKQGGRYRIVAAGGVGAE